MIAPPSISAANEGITVWLLHSHRATALKPNLLLLRDPRIVVINVPWYVQHGEPKPADAEAPAV